MTLLTVVAALLWLTAHVTSRGGPPGPGSTDASAA